MKKVINAVTAGILVLTLGACGSSGSHATTENAYFDGGYGIAEGAAYDSYAAEAPLEAEVESAKTEDNGTETPAITGDMLVYTGSMTIETLDYEETVKAVRERISSYKGIIQDQNEWDGDKSWYYTDGRARTSNRTLSMTVRIPTESFDSFMSDMEGTGKMTNRSENVENISRQYSDNAIEIEALEKQQERLLEMMDAAKTVEEMILVEERLSEVQRDLNQKKSRRSNMDTDVKYSTIHLNVNEVQKYTPIDNGIRIDGFGEKVKEAFEESWVNFVYFLEQLVLFLIGVLPFVAVIAIICFIIAAVRKSKGLDPNPFHGRKGKEKANKTINPGEPKDKPEQK
ncbi:MAG: DUF4349 domain-containing protein [Solobacterium sp.]|nr:DUF4349 domain-containing protein [Solobacterium sp.]